MAHWPANWESLVRGVGCGICASGRPDSDQFGINIYRGEFTDAYLQRADIQRGYTVVIWRGRHVWDPTDLTGAETTGYFGEMLIVARALMAHYRPLIINYQTLGNSLPHLHTHLIPRYPVDPAPGQPFPLPETRPSAVIPGDQLGRDVKALRKALDPGGTRR